MNVLLHLGAHKTASTYLQTRLFRSRARLRMEGVEIVVPEQFRTLVQRPTDNGGPLRFLGRLTRSRLDLQMQALRHFVALAEKKGFERIVISEENLLGQIPHLLKDRPLYEDAKRRMQRIAQALEGHRLTIALSIRSHATFNVSVLGHFLRRGHYDVLNEKVYAQMIRRRRGWSDVVDDLIRAAPEGTEFVVWRYEDLRQGEEEILRNLVGAPAAVRVAPVNYRPMVGPSDKAVRRLLATLKNNPNPDPTVIDHTLRARSQRQGYAPFNPWTVDQENHFAERYQRDIKALIRQLGSAFLYPMPDLAPPLAADSAAATGSIRIFTPRAASGVGATLIPPDQSGVSI